MSSFGRTFIPIGLAIAFGVWNGYYAFNPAFKEQEKTSQQSTAKDIQPRDKATEVNNERKLSKDDASPNR
ncbi:hypothetical protein F5Y05DRAFT_412020 [Hypoxylon sp. FL0543]|nr:hypothetical protein F5Y05DRAFT_412020 [Hypoxylon sp. FL0543]